MQFSTRAFILGITVSGVLMVAATTLPWSKKASDASNLKQCLLAVIIYAVDHDEHFPLAHNWMDAASSYAKNEDVFHCLPHQNTDKYGHALNESLAGTSSLAVGHPDRRIALFDSTNLNRNGVSPLTELTKHGRNDQQTVVGFVDGHIKIIRPEPEPFELHPLFDFLVGSGLVISSTMVSISILGMGRAIVARTRGRRTGLVSSE